MSALRLGRLPDGTRDIRIVDDGAVGRIHMTRYGMRGAFVVGQKPAPLPVPATSPARRAQIAEYKARKRAGVLCRRVMRSSKECFRSLGHRGECRNAESMELRAARKRTGGVVR